MSRNGGYTILDLSNVKLEANSGATPPTYEGVVPISVYNAVRNSGKAVMVSGMTLDGYIYPDSLSTNVNRNNLNYIQVGYMVNIDAEMLITITATGAITVNEK